MVLGGFADADRFQNAKLIHINFDPKKQQMSYKPLVRWRDMETTVLGKRSGEDLLLLQDPDLNLEDEFDDGADWLNRDHRLPAEFKTVKKNSSVLAGCDGTDLRSLYLCELLSESSAKQAPQPVSAPMKKVGSSSQSHRSF
ncbi:hypothetical protein BDR07DRAFT_1482906 [Suillus spraguei]|nr:hypothetical protein BDR07DRAFT_1482906 [Suillus spraguei]